MIDLIDEKAIELRKEAKQKKLIEIVNSELKDIKIHSPYIGNVSLYKPLFRFLNYSKKREIMGILDCDICFRIDLKNKNYVTTAKSIGEKIEKEYKIPVRLYHYGLC